MTEVFATAFYFHGNTDHKSVVMCTQNLFLCITSLTLIIDNVLLWNVDIEVTFSNVWETTAIAQWWSVIECGH